MTHPITTITDKEVHNKINDVLFQLREEGITRDGDGITNLLPEQYQHLVIRMARENITLARLNLSREKYIENYNQRLAAVNDAMNIIGGSFKIIKNILRQEYEAE